MGGGAGLERNDCATAERTELSGLCMNLYTVTSALEEGLNG